MLKKLTETQKAIAQEAFDKAVPALLKQGERSMSHSGSGLCAYRSYNGCKCAVGFLIEDELYDHKIEQTSVSKMPTGLHGFSDLGAKKNLHSIIRKSMGWNIRGDSLIWSVLRDMQIVHDKHTPPYWVDRFRDLAKEWGLDASCIEEVLPEFRAKMGY